MKYLQQVTHRWQLLGRLLGAGLLVATGAVPVSYTHLDVYKRQGDEHAEADDMHERDGPVHAEDPCLFVRGHGVERLAEHLAHTHRGCERVCRQRGASYHLSLIHI